MTSTTTATATQASEQADPLAARSSPDRPYHATGVLLGADDFTDEQTYHRARLARALAYLSGGGTLIGLRVVVEANADATRHALKVLPGLAIDRWGRLIEVPRAWCLRLQPWWAARSADELRAAHGAQGVVADLFLRFAAVARGRTPGFAQGAFDATDATVPSRLRDAFHLDLVLRPDARTAPDSAALPTARFQVLRGVAQADRADALADALLDGWTDATNPHAHDLARPDSGALPPLPEHGAGLALVDTSALFLARLRLPTLQPPEAVAPGAKPDADFAALDDSRLDNRRRRFALPGDALAALLGL
jgi:hypothetical protein